MCKAEFQRGEEDRSLICWFILQMAGKTNFEAQSQDTPGISHMGTMPKHLRDPPLFLQAQQ